MKIEWTADDGATWIENDSGVLYLCTITRIPLNRVMQLHTEPRGLTKTQLIVMQLLFEFLTYKEIAQRMGIVERTVKYHVNKVLSKYGCKTRTDFYRKFLVQPGV